MDGLIAYASAKKYVDKVLGQLIDIGFTVQVEQDRSILNGVGEEKVLYLIPKTTAKPQDGYDEFIYTNNSWEQVGVTDVDLNYKLLSNKPQINGRTLSGNKYDSDLGLQGQLVPENGLYIRSGNRIGLDNYFGYLQWLTNGDLDDPGIYALNSLGYFDAQTWGASLPENEDCYVASLAPNPTSYMVQVAFAIASKKTYTRTSTNQETQKTWGAWEELSGGAAIASGVINSNGTITFYDENGTALFTTSGANLVTSGNQQISMGYDNGGFYFLFDDGGVTNGTS